jgi:hypothetical protein
MVCVFGEANRFAVDELDEETRLVTLVYRQLVLLESHPANLWAWLDSGVKTIAPRMAEGLPLSHSSPVVDGYRGHLLPLVWREHSLQALFHVFDLGVDPWRIKIWMRTSRPGSAWSH